MVRGHQGFTLIELMIVVVIMGILVAIALPAFNNMTNQARVAQVKSSMHTVQVTVEDFAARNDGVYPSGAAAQTSEGNMTLQALLPSATMPLNPFTNVATTLDWSNAAGTAPVSDPAGGISLNVTQSVAGGAWDIYEVIGADHQNIALSLILSNS